MHASWVHAGAEAAPAVPHVLVVAVTTVAVVLAIIVIWILVAFAVQDSGPATFPLGPLPEPGLDL